MGRKKHVHPDVHAQLQERYEARVHEIEEAIRGMQVERGVLDEEARRASRHLMLVEKEHVLEAHHRGVISQEALEAVLRDVDARMGELED